MPGEEIVQNKGISHQEIERREPDAMPKQIINVDNLNGRVCYFSLSGNLALQAYEDINFSTFGNTKKKRLLKQALTDRLHFAILMFDKVVMHCSDPLRSELVLNVLEEHIEWIQFGKIVFIVSNHIENIRNDYQRYIQQKIQEYEDGYCSSTEAESLKQDYMDENYFNRVERVLEASPYLVRKSTNVAYYFPTLVLNDLNPEFQREQVIIDASSNLPQILSLSLTLYQLLHIREFSVTKDDLGQVHHVFPQSVVERVSSEIQRHLRQRNTIARAAIVDSLKEELKKEKLTKIQELVLDAVSLRMDVLYCHMNSGQQMILEFHPSYEQRSIYQVDCFLNYMKMVAQSDRIVKLSRSIIDKILETDELSNFRLFYLASTADMKEQMNLAQLEYRKYGETTKIIFTDIVCEYINTERDNKFSKIKNLLNGEAI